MMAAPHRGSLGDRHATTVDPNRADPVLGNYIFAGLQTQNWVYVLFSGAASPPPCWRSRSTNCCPDRKPAFATAAACGALGGVGIAALVAATLVPPMAALAVELYCPAPRPSPNNSTSALIAQPGCARPDYPQLARGLGLQCDFRRARGPTISTSMSTIPARCGPTNFITRYQARARNCLTT